MKKLLLILTTFMIAQASVQLSVDSFVNDTAEWGTTLGTVSFDVLITNADPVAGFQIDVLSNEVLEITGASGGLSEEAGFMLSNSGTTILGFSLLGATIPAGTGTLCTITASYDPAVNPTDLVISAVEEGPSGTRLLFSAVSGTPLEAEFDTYTTTLLDSDPAEIVEYSLADNHPNPFNPTTTINFSIASYGEVELVVFDALGREVNRLVSGVYTPGKYSAVWDGRDVSGNEMSSGMYFYRLNSEGFTQTKKMLFVK